MKTKLDFFCIIYKYLQNYPFVPYWLMTPFRRLVRDLANRSLTRYLDKPCPCSRIIENDLVVSLTTFPARVNYVWQVVECMLRQTICPSKIILWLSKDQFTSKSDIPESLRKREGSIFEIRMVEGDIRSHKKYYYAAKEFPNSKIFIVDDDIYYPNKLERQIEEISKYDDETILYSNYDLIDLEGNKFNTVILDHEMLKNKPDYALLEGLIGGITLLIPKQAFEECGMFDEKYRCVQDYIKWFEFIKKYHFVHMPEVLAASRVHPKQVTYNSPVMIKEGNYLWAYMIENYPKEKKIACEGSCYAFYQEMENHLKTTPYREAEQKVHELKIQCLEKEKDSKLPSITIVVIGKEEKERTISSIKKQTIKEYKIIETNSLEKSLKNIDTDYYTFLTSGTTVKENWLENILTIAKISNKSVIISDYKKPLLAGSIDNYCSYLVPLDGVIFKNEGNVKFINSP